MTDVILTQVVNPMRPDIPLYPVQLDGSYQIFSEGICAYVLLITGFCNVTVDDYIMINLKVTLIMDCFRCASELDLSEVYERFID